MLFTDLIDIQHAYIILCNRHDDPHQEQDAEVDEDGVGGRKTSTRNRAGVRDSHANYGHRRDLRSIVVA
jgi:hypothetical protein